MNATIIFSTVEAIDDENALALSQKFSRNAADEISGDTPAICGLHANHFCHQHGCVFSLRQTWKSLACDLEDASAGVAATGNRQSLALDIGGEFELHTGEREFDRAVGQRNIRAIYLFRW